MAWYKHISNGTSLAHCKDVLAMNNPVSYKSYLTRFRDLKLPDVPKQSLYKSDPKRLNPASRFFTRQYAVEQAMDKVLEAVEILEAEVINRSDTKKNLKWEDFPSLVHPKEGGTSPCQF